ncbi:MAG: ZIP family metal transporter [Firmicutes bacterium]|nr:ZIP family metal transporter [Bacillota bacterium]
MWESVLISSLAGLATGVGALLVVLFGRPSRRFLSVMLGIAGGLMLAISVFELLPEATELGNHTTTVIGFILGAGLMALLDVILPHLHKNLQTSEGGAVASLECAIDQSTAVAAGDQLFSQLDLRQLLYCGLFLAIGIALHNMPEGLAIGAGYSNSATLGATIALSLALHNVPEGMVTAAPLLVAGMDKWLVIAIASAAGLVTPIGTLIGAALISISPEFISISMALAAGAMIYIVSDELIPQSHEYHSHAANFGLVAGFILGYIL